MRSPIHGLVLRTHPDSYPHELLFKLNGFLKTFNSASAPILVK